ncbi:rhombosortase [Shewanella xiamenensis]|uniref:Rhombosortase n=1 Tax=Shewanella xiamenensis TaxID=332186 RepID=A0ABT6UIQ2_9GAMM|nr:rhombosortase [Shewanella xiamenensis]MDI5834345.1 rhombosortase [Shewanella xiamenensis]
MRLVTFNKLSPYWLALIVSVLCALLYVAGLFTPSVDTLLAYRRSDISDDQWWRLITGNLLHTNHWHLLMNLAGLWVVLFLHHFHYQLRGLTVLFILLCLFEGIGLYLGYPQLLGYVGLSGMLHGLFTFGAVQDIRRKMRSGYLLMIGVIVKVGHEQFYGASDDVTAMIGARVATEAHLVGLICGLVCALLFFMLPRTMLTKEKA